MEKEIIHTMKTEREKEEQEKNYIPPLSYEDKRLIKIEEKIDRDSLGEQIKKCLSALSPMGKQIFSHREKEILTLRFGLESGIPMSIKEVSKKLNLSSTRIQKIEEQAFRKLRHPNQTEELKPWL